MPQEPHVDSLVQRFVENQTNLAAIGKEIERSRQTKIVMFVDLCNSTEMKHSTAPEKWLAYVYSFIHRIQQLTSENNGFVVKRIGDELMLTFSDVADSEAFLTTLKADENLNSSWRFKVAIDHGIVYTFSFGIPGDGDPYGTTVDRCARIAKLAKADVVLCSASYRNSVGDASRIFFLGRFAFKGFTDPEEVFIRWDDLRPPSKSYLAPLLAALNGLCDNAGYLYTPRMFAESYFQFDPSTNARPFLLRELLNVPKLPYSFPDFYERMREKSDEEKKAFNGHLVEWEGPFESYNRKPGLIEIILNQTIGHGSGLIRLTMTSAALDVASKLKKGEIVRFRGVLMWIFLMICDVNYVKLVSVK